MPIVQLDSRALRKSWAPWAFVAGFILGALGALAGLLLFR